ncbi:hypothetical protein, partial [Mesorhizobium dulcispinae]|uniref:hypothetical protein n=1 Tax=Mesorhizobium dulcispinae TaxID=3072316 RepID=UPI002A239B63
MDPRVYATELLSCFALGLFEKDRVVWRPGLQAHHSQQSRRQATVPRIGQAPDVIMVPAVFVRHRL